MHVMRAVIELIRPTNTAQIESAPQTWVFAPCRLAPDPYLEAQLSSALHLPTAKACPCSEC